MNAALSREAEPPRPGSRKLRKKLKRLVMCEASGVFVWSMISFLLRMGFSFLTALSLMRTNEEESSKTSHYCSHPGGGVGGFSQGHEEPCAKYQVDNTAPNSTHGRLLNETIIIVSVLVGWGLSILPSKVAKLSYSGYGSAPGFSFASTWILYPIRDYFGSIPNLPTRICETTMGRLTLQEMAIILPVHFLVPAIDAYSFQFFFPASISRHAIDPIIYSERNPWIVDFMRETFVNALFTVGLLVVPELLKINGIRRCFAFLILYPLYSYGVDASGTASVFGPDIIYALRCVSKREEVPLTQWCHMLGPILGGIIGGKIMLSAFPDNTM